MKRLTLTFGLLALATALAACSGAAGAPAGSPAPVGSPAANAVTIVAKDLKFGTSSVAVRAAAPFELVFDNQDAAPHNVAISDASGKSVYKGEIVSSKAVSGQVGALAAGTYSFLCEVHPDMKGTITAS